MTTTPNVGPMTLRSDYLSASHQVLLLQSYANLLLQQVPLDLPVDAGLAFEIATYQQQMRDMAREANDSTIPAYIRLFTKGTNFSALWRSLLDVDLPLLKVADSNAAARTSVYHAFAELSDQAGTTNQVASAFVDDLSILNGTLDELDSMLHTALDASLKQLGASATAEAAKIDELKAAITQNINDIVAGATKTGKAAGDLFIGVLTSISGAKADGPEAGEGEGEGSAKKGDDGKAGKDEGSSEPPSADFAVSAIQGASEGAAQTEQARADLNANNEKLAAAIQALAQVNALIAVAKVVSVQNELFTSAMKAVQQNYADLAATWGVAPITPPGSGISLEFANFAEQVQAVSSPQDVDRLVRLVKHAATDWDLVNEELLDLKRAMLGIT